LLAMLLPILVFAQKKGDQEATTLLLDNWHKAATEANLEAYFGALSEDAIFLGTDPSERWTKKQFYDFSEPFFKKGKAWDFKASQRNLVFSEDSRYAWFDELLDTWMGTCRGSGVLKKVGKNWKIVQYNLTITVPNDLTKDYLKILKEFTEKSKKE